MSPSPSCTEPDHGASAAEADPIAHLLRPDGQDQPLADRLGGLTCEPIDDATLMLRGELRAGLYEMSLATCPDGFDVDSILIDLVEWPSRRQVKAGPFDFDHTQYRMAVPTFRVWVNGEDQGLVWAEVPSPDDMSARRLRALWGVQVHQDGPVAIRLDVAPEDRRRLRWDALAEVILRPDDRYSLPLDASVSREIVHPRLFLDTAGFERLAAAREPTQQALLERLVAWVESGRDYTYAYRTIALALVGRVKDDPRARAEAIERTLALCGREDWGYHDNPEIMGWNNDRDAGDRMLETAVVFDWLYDDLDESQRRILIEKLARHADLAEQVTRLQKNYWYYRCCEAHGQGLWMGFTAAAAALLGHDARAPQWLEWAIGNFDDALRHLPCDGIAVWTVFNMMWHIYELALLEGLLGRPLEGPYPFLDGYARNAPAFLPDSAGNFRFGTLLLYLARRSGDGRTQADAYRAMRLNADGTGHGGVHPLAVLLHDAAVAPSAPTPAPPVVRSESGLVFCRAPAGGVRFAFQCGTPCTPRHHESHNWINRAWYGISHAGSFAWFVDEPRKSGSVRAITLAPFVVDGYRKRSNDVNVITVNGAGLYLHERSHGGRTPLTRVPSIEHFASIAGVTCCRANILPAYADACRLQHASRRWAFLHDLGVVVMLDRMVAEAPLPWTWNLHARRESWQQEGSACFATVAHGHRLVTRILQSTCDGRAADVEADLRVTIENSQWVPRYTTGMNAYKTRDWQPEICPDQINVPDYPALRITPRDPVASWQVLTVMGVDCDAVEAARPRESGAVAGAYLPGWGSVLFPLGQDLTLPQWRLNVTADVVACVEGEDPRCIAFGASGWSDNGEVTDVDDPVDRVWRAGDRVRNRKDAT